MSTTNGTQSTAVTLSDAGFAAFFEEREEVRAHAVLVNGVLTPSTRKTGKSVLIKKYNDSDYNAYVKKLMEFASTNTIQSTDKVYFAKNSQFPRTMFNRYSDKARRVEAASRADKWVIGNSIDTGWGGNDMQLVGSKYVVNMNIIDSEVMELFSRLSNRTHLKWRKTIAAAQSNYYVNKREFNTQFFNEMGDPLLQLSTEAWTTVPGKNSKELDTINLLRQGEPYTNLVTDKVATRYINSFKSPLNASSYKTLVAALGQGPNNVTVGMKLLENMNLDGSDAYVYALFANVYSTNGQNIRANSAYNGVNFKNLRNAYNLDQLMQNDYYANSMGALALDRIERIYTSVLKDPVEKETYRGLVDEVIHQSLTAMIGEKAYDMLNFNTLEDESENDIIETD